MENTSEELVFGKSPWTKNWEDCGRGGEIFKKLEWRNTSLEVTSIIFIVYFSMFLARERRNDDWKMALSVSGLA